jgi:hypothetical protein
MTEFKAMDDRVEVNGETVLSVVAGMGVYSDKARQILKKNGIDDPKPGEWYPQQAWLDAFKEISDNVGQNALFEIGKQIPENAQWPPNVDSVAGALASIDVAYHINHRIEGEQLFNPKNGEMKEGIGHYSFEKTGDREGVMKCDNPYPCSFDTGIIEAAAHKFAHESEHIVLMHEEEGGCRKEGGKCCTYHIKW